MYVGPLLVGSSVIVIFYALCCNYYYFGKNKSPIKRKQGVNDCFKPLIPSVFTTVASRLKSEPKEKEQ